MGTNTGERNAVKINILPALISSEEGQRNSFYCRAFIASFLAVPSAGWGDEPGWLPWGSDAPHVLLFLHRLHLSHSFNIATSSRLFHVKTFPLTMFIPQLIT